MGNRLGRWLSFATILVGIAPAKALACVCEEATQPLRDHVQLLYDESDTVGVFVVGDTRRFRLVVGGDSRLARWVELRASRLFKGSTRELHAYSAPRWLKSDCDLQHVEGTVILVFARDDKPVSLNACANSGRIEQRLDELQVLFEMTN